jgi:hypothetical protein
MHRISDSSDERVLSRLTCLCELDWRGAGVV